MDKYCVYGNPIKQSRSPYIHQFFAKNTSQDMDYVSFLAPLDGFKAAVLEFASAGGKGANVTAPFKEEAMALCDHLSEHAKLSGAVNTLTFKNGKIYGDTTDGIGLVSDLLANDIALTDQRILLLGAGGASKGVVSPLLDQKPSLLMIANRTVSKAQAIVEQYSNQPLSACSFEEANQQSFDVIINATSAGLTGGGLPISDDLFTAQTSCYDMTYGKVTPFIAKANELKVKKVVDGLGMLVGQAAQSFYIWRSVRPEVNGLLAELRVEIENS